MKKFNKNFVAGATWVQLQGEYGYRLVKSLSESRLFIKVHGLEGEFQRGHVITYTNNKDKVTAYPALEDIYLADQYGSVYKRGTNQLHFVGKLNGRTLAEFAADFSEQD